MLDNIRRARLDEIIMRSQKTGASLYTRFLSMADAQEFMGRAKAAGLFTAAFGGYEGADRVMCGVCGYQELLNEDFPIIPILVSWDKRFYEVEHHDILGAVMALGLDRDLFGDIAMRKDGGAYIMAGENAARIIENGLVSCGRANVSVERCGSVDIAPPVGRQITATFKSLRLDAVVAEGLRTARSHASAYIAAGRDSINHVVCMKNDKAVSPPDIISVQGKGRIELKEIGGKSNKDRTYLTMETFLRD